MKLLTLVGKVASYLLILIALVLPALPVVREYVFTGTVTWSINLVLDMVLEAAISGCLILLAWATLEDVEALKNRRILIHLDNMYCYL